MGITIAWKCQLYIVSWWCLDTFLILDHNTIIVLSSVTSFRLKDIKKIFKKYHLVESSIWPVVENLTHSDLMSCVTDHQA